MNDKTDITTAEQWPARRDEIKTIMQDNSYGQWRSGETVDYSVSGNTLSGLIDVICVICGTFLIYLL